MSPKRRCTGAHRRDSAAPVRQLRPCIAAEWSIRAVPQSTARSADLQSVPMAYPEILEARSSTVREHLGSFVLREIETLLMLLSGISTLAVWARLPGG